MAEGSTRVLIALSAIILVLSFKDLLITNTSVDQAATDESPKPEKTSLPINEDFNEDDVLKAHNFDDDDDEIKDDNIPIQKEIPKLKINNNNIQQLKFLFW